VAFTLVAESFRRKGLRKTNDRSITTAPANDQERVEKKGKKESKGTIRKKPLVLPPLKKRRGSYDTRRWP